jgi:hypothetical protein
MARAHCTNANSSHFPHQHPSIAMNMTSQSNVLTAGYHHTESERLARSCTSASVLEILLYPDRCPNNA